MQLDLVFLSEAIHAAEKVANLSEGAPPESLHGSTQSKTT